MQLRKPSRASRKNKWGSKASTSRLFSADHCESGFVEKLISIGMKRYTYYKCTKYGGTKRCDENTYVKRLLLERIAKINWSIQRQRAKDSQENYKGSAENERTSGDCHGWKMQKKSPNMNTSNTFWKGGNAAENGTFKHSWGPTLPQIQEKCG